MSKFIRLCDGLYVSTRYIESIRVVPTADGAVLMLTTEYGRDEQFNSYPSVDAARAALDEMMVRLNGVQVLEAER